jgi:hypothetical protein
MIGSQQNADDVALKEPRAVEDVQHDGGRRRNVAAVVLRWTGEKVEEPTNHFSSIFFRRTATLSSSFVEQTLT